MPRPRRRHCRMRRGQVQDVARESRATATGVADKAGIGALPSVASSSLPPPTPNLPPPTLFLADLSLLVCSTATQPRLALAALLGSPPPLSPLEPVSVSARLLCCTLLCTTRAPALSFRPPVCLSRLCLSPSVSASLPPSRPRPSLVPPSVPPLAVLPRLHRTPCTAGTQCMACCITVCECSKHENIDLSSSRTHLVRFKYALSARAPPLRPFHYSPALAGRLCKLATVVASVSQLAAARRLRRPQSSQAVTTRTTRLGKYYSSSLCSALYDPHCCV